MWPVGVDVDVRQWLFLQAGLTYLVVDAHLGHGLLYAGAGGVARLPVVGGLQHGRSCGLVLHGVPEKKSTAFY